MMFKIRVLLRNIPINGPSERDKTVSRRYIYNKKKKPAEFGRRFLVPITVNVVNQIIRCRFDGVNTP